MKLWLSLMVWLFANAAAAQVGIFDCSLPTGSKTFAFKSTNGMVEVIRPEIDEQRLTVEERSLTDEGKTVVVTKWPTSQKTISVASITPHEDRSGKIIKLDFETLTVENGKTVKFSCSINPRMQLALDEGLNKLIERLAELPNPEDVIAAAVQTTKPKKKFDKEAFLKGVPSSVAKCWNVGSLSADALRVSVTVSFTLDAELKPDPSSIRLESSSNGSAAAVKQAFDAARRAILRCGVGGFNEGLVKKFGSQSVMEPLQVSLTFNPEKVRIVPVE